MKKVRLQKKITVWKKVVTVEEPSTNISAYSLKLSPQKKISFLKQFISNLLCFIKTPIFLFLSFFYYSYLQNISSPHTINKNVLSYRFYNSDKTIFFQYLLMLHENITTQNYKSEIHYKL